MIRGLEISNSIIPKCEDCILGKCTRENFKITNRPLKVNILELIHVDLFGPILQKSLGGSKYVLCVVDDCSRRITVLFLKHKSEAAENLKKFIKRAERETGRLVKTVRSDNGGEFTCEELKEYFIEKGIKHETTIPYSPEQNGVAERMNRTLKDMATTMLIDSGLPKHFWAEAVATSAYIRNRCITKAIDNKTPEEVWRGGKPTASHFRVFGSIAYAWIPKQHRNKFDEKSRPAIMVGYYDDKQAYRLYNPDNNTFFACKKPVFLENKKGADLLGKVPRVSGQNETLLLHDKIEHHEVCGDRNEDEDENEENENVNNEMHQENIQAIDNLNEEANNTDCRRSQRQRKQTDRLQIQPDLKSYCNMSKEEIVPPTCYNEAVKGTYRKEWRESMEEEMNSQEEMKTWKIVKREKAMHILRSKWVYVLKYKNNEVKFKSRLVAVGYNQRKGIDYIDTYSPVLKLTTLRILLTIANQFDMELRQLDVKTAYLNGNMDENIYMEIPDGFYLDKSREKYVCKLEKSLYGLKQSGRAWNLKLNEELKALKFSRLECDRCVYVKKNKDGIIILGVYVDDFFVMASNKEIMMKFIEEIKQKFDIKDLGEPNVILGIHVTRSRKEKTISIDQEGYIQELLRKYNMENCNIIKTPMEIGLKLKKSEKEIDEKIPYHNLVGGLMYLVQATRPDLAYPVHYLSQFNNYYDGIHWKHLKRILRYLKYTKNVKLTFDNKF